MNESLVIGRSFMMYRVMFFLVEHLFGDLAYTQGEHNPLPLMTKGENDFE